jgi:hypothetical protein
MSTVFENGIWCKHGVRVNIECKCGVRSKIGCKPGVNRQILSVKTVYIFNDMVKGKQRISAYIPDELYTRLVQSECNITDVIIKGIELVLEPEGEEKEYIHIETAEPKLLEAKESVIEALKARTNDLNERISSLEVQLQTKDNQISEKDKQIENKDSQLEKQAVHIQTLLINQKAIEAPGAKKPWWRFW